MGAPAGYPPHVLREYALLADGQRGVLVGPKGDFAWMCMPRWDSEAVFSTLVGGTGLYALSPDGEQYVWGGSYDEASLIWRSRWVTTTGIVECREALAFPGQADTAVVLRRVVAVHGDARVRVVLDPRAGFGQATLDDLHRERGVWTARTGGLHVRWTGGRRARRQREGGLVDVIEVAEGTHHDLVLELSTRPLGGLPVDPAAAWRSTEAAWARSVPELPGILARRDARHAYAVLRGLTSAGGGMVAAATTSLPERAEEGRNYDYRYAWIRDQSYVGQAAAVTQPDPLLDDAVRFISERVLADGPDLAPAYRVDGTPVPDERQLEHLPGYPGGTNRIGNRVNHQFQLDTHGEVLLLLAAAARHDRLDAGHWRAAETTVATIEARWRQPDAGVWEIDDQPWAHSRLMCVAGLRALGPFAPAAQRRRWQRLARSIEAEVASTCLHPSGRWQRAPGDARVDAALLLPAIRGAVPAGDPRSRATLAAVGRSLGSDGYVYRFRHDHRPLERAEGAFLLCGFLMALGTHQVGRTVEAMGWFERNRAAGGPAGLLTEEVDVRQRQLRGNVPQAFVHALLLESASRLSAPWA